MSLLDSLKQHTVVVADTGDLDAIREHQPQDATTNPSLILKAAKDVGNERLVAQALEAARSGAADEAATLNAFLDHLFVAFGREILEIVPGRVSTEVDARLSFDAEGTVSKARRLIGMYEEAGISRERVLIKIASTWEGIVAARALEAEGIHCNMTLLFSFAQAVACANAGVTLISPFVGRIYDYWRDKKGVEDIAIADDPGVRSVARIYDHYKKHGIATEVMGASFRKVDQIVALSGCDLLTIAPDLLESMRNSDAEAPAQLTVEAAKTSDSEPLTLEEREYRWLHNEDEMAVAKLAEGIRRFDRDARQLEAFARERLTTG